MLVMLGKLVTNNILGWNRRVAETPWSKCKTVETDFYSMAKEICIDCVLSSVAVTFPS